MKYLYLIITFVFLQSCISVIPVLSGSTSAAYVKDKGDFVQLNNGTIIENKIGKNNFRDGGAFLNHTGSIEINNQKYGYKDVFAFQQDSIYYRKTSKYVEFVQRIVKGKINIYMRPRELDRITSHSQTLNVRTEVHQKVDFQYPYIQKGDNGDIVDFEVNILEKMVSDYQPSLDCLESFKKEKLKYRDAWLDKAIRLYNEH